MAQWEGVHYSDHDMLNMQQEAIRRVRQMQQRARQSISGGQPPAGNMGMLRKEPEQAPPSGGQNVSHFAGESVPQDPGGGGAASSQRGPFAQGPQEPPAGRPSSPLGRLGERLGLLAQGGDGEKQGLGGLIMSVIGENSPAARALEALGLDNERLLLIGLLLVLMNEKADRTLLMALVYLLL